MSFEKRESVNKNRINDHLNLLKKDVINFDRAIEKTTRLYDLFHKLKQVHSDYCKMYEGVLLCMNEELDTDEFNKLCTELATDKLIEYEALLDNLSDNSVSNYFKGYEDLAREFSREHGSKLESFITERSFKDNFGNPNELPF